MEENSTTIFCFVADVICPASGLNGVMDVAIRDRKDRAVQTDILPASAKEVSTFADAVLPG